MSDIRIFGDEAKNIREGDMFTAKIYYVEGHKCVRLVKE